MSMASEKTEEEKAACDDDICVMSGKGRMILSRPSLSSFFLRPFVSACLVCASWHAVRCRLLSPFSSFQSVSKRS